MFVIVMPMMVRARIIASGIVQGVFFRFNTMKKAQECGVNRAGTINSDSGIRGFAALY